MFMVAIAATFTFSSCGSDGEEYDPENPVVGTWVGSESGSDYTVTYEIIMKSNGSFKRTSVEIFKGEEDKFVDSGDYVVVDNTITVKWTDATEEELIGEVETIKYSLSEDGNTVSLWVHGNNQKPLVLTRK